MSCVLVSKLIVSYKNKYYTKNYLLFLLSVSTFRFSRTNTFFEIKSLINVKNYFTSALGTSLPPKGLAVKYPNDLNSGTVSMSKQQYSMLLIKEKWKYIAVYGANRIGEFPWFWLFTKCAIPPGVQDQKKGPFLRPKSMFCKDFLRLCNMARKFKNQLDKWPFEN